METLLVLILLVPLATAIFLAFGIRRWGLLSSWLGTASSLVLLGLIVSLVLGREGVVSTVLYSWLKVGGISVDIGLEVGELGGVMLLVVGVVGALVHIFSLAYMADDGNRGRYYSGLSLFLFSMIGIVMADNFIVMFLFWELVGVSSYLLIGHWYSRREASGAALKAFLVNRVGDFGFLLGILILWGLTGSLGFAALSEAAAETSESAPALFAAAILLVFCGAVGKSAQLPLHVWLPDAMEGPTPVSALIHAATMVAAGVFMLARTAPIIGEAAAACEVIAYVGGGTAIFAALVAIGQDDIKRILAYSTLSQLGYMVMAVGLAAPVAHAAPEAMFHLYTHAFFKALLFLGAGAVIYACHHEQDIWKMGGLLKKMPVVGISFLFGALALAGFPFLFSGFYSKEAILALASDHSRGDLLVIGLVTAMLTAFYMTRLVLVVFFGRGRGEGAQKAHAPGAVMWLPLVILAILSTVIAVGVPLVGGVPSWMGIEGAIGMGRGAEHGHHGLPEWMLVGGSILVLAVGAGAGWLLYNGVERDPLNFVFLRQKFYVDGFYAWLVRVFQDGLGWVLDGLDKLLLDGLIVRGSAALADGAGQIVRRFQAGRLQVYAALFGVGVLILFALLFAGQ
jgi:NADH-quinone oxidoreductase subunit L